MRLFQSIRQLCARSPFHQSGNFACACSFQSRKQLCVHAPLSVSKTRIQPSPYFIETFPLHTTWPETSFFYLHKQLILTPTSHQGQRNPHTPPPLLGVVASVCGLWPQCGHLETTQAVTLKSGSSMTLLQFLNLPCCGENCIRKFSCFSVRVGACGTGLPAGLPIKENPGEPNP